MKLVFKKIKDWKEHVDYIADIAPSKSVHMVLPRDVLRLDKVPYNIVAFFHTSSSDPELHLCHKCNKMYPAFQYAKHSKSHTGLIND